MKKSFYENQLDLLNDNNYSMLLKVFRKDDRKAEASVHQARASQSTYAEFEKRCTVAKHNLYPRTNMAEPLGGISARRAQTSEDLEAVYDGKAPSARIGIPSAATDFQTTGGSWAPTPTQGVVKHINTINFGNKKRGSFGVGHGFPYDTDAGGISERSQELMGSTARNHMDSLYSNSVQTSTNYNKGSI